MPSLYGSTEADSLQFPRMPNLQEVESIRRYSRQQQLQQQTPPSSKRQQYGASILAISNFFVACCVSLQAPLFPQEAEYKGMSPTTYGMAFGTFHLVVLILSLVFGKLIPSRVESKTGVVFGLMLTGISAVLFGSLDKVPSGTCYNFLVFLVRGLDGCGTACFHASSYLIVMAHFPDNVATYLGVLETMFAFGVVCGPLLGSIMYQAGGFLVPFTVLGVCIILCALACLTIPCASGESTVKPRTGLLPFLKNQEILLDALTICVACTVTGFNQVTLEPHLRQFELAPTAEGAVFIITGAVYAITTPLWGRLCDFKVNVKVWTVLGFIIIAIELLLIGPVPFLSFKPQLWLICVALALLGVGIGGALIAPFAGSLQKSVEKGLVSDLGTYGLLSSMFSSSASLGAFFGSSFGGIFLETIGYENGTLILLAVVAFVTAYSVGYLIMRRPRDTDSEPEKKEEASTSKERAEEKQPLLQKKDKAEEEEEESDEDDSD